MELRGRLGRVVWRDRRFAVVEVATDGGESVRASGPLGSVTVGMPVAFEAERRGGEADRAYGEEWKVSTVGEVPETWRRLAGLTALLDVAAEAERGALVGAVSALRWAAEQTESPEPARSALWRAAEAMGVAGLDWLVGVSRARSGPDGPVVVAANPASMVGAGVIEPGEALRLGAAWGGEVGHQARTEGALGVIRRDLLRSGRSAIPARKAARRVAEAFDVGLEDLSDGLVAHGSVLVPKELSDAAEAVWAACESIAGGPARAAGTLRGLGELGTDGATVAAGVAESPLSLVVSPAGAEGRFLADLAAAFGPGEVSVRHADRRGSLVGRWPGGEVPGAGVVALTDVHRLSADELGARLGEAQNRSAVVLVGDDWLACPGALGGVFADLVAAARWPCHRLAGAGAAWELRGGHDIRRHPALRVGAPERSGRVARIRYGEPAELVRRPGAKAMAVAGFAGYGPGATGVVERTGEGVTMDADGHSVELGPGVAERLGGGDYVPFGWLAGVSLDALWLTARVRSRQGLYAMAAAARTLWIDDESFLSNLNDEPIRGPGRSRP